MIQKESLHRDYSLLAGFLRSVSLRLRLRSALELLLLFSSGFLLVLLGSLFIFELKKIFPYLPFLYSLCAILCLAFLLLLGLWRIFSIPSTVQVARGLEEKFPQLRDDVTNSILLFDEVSKDSCLARVSEVLITAQLRKTAKEVSGMKPSQMVSLKTLLWHLRLLVPLLLAFSFVLALAPHFPNRSLAMIFHPFSELPIRETLISIEPRGSIVLRGTQVVIRTKVTGNIPNKLMLTIWPEGREMRSLPMDSDGEGRFTYRMMSAQFSFRYQAQDGRAVSSIYLIRVVDPPDVEKVKLTLIPPDYSGLPERVQEEGFIEALKGTVVHLEARVNKGVTEGKLILNQESELLLKVLGNRLLGNLLVFNPGTYSIKVKDDFGFDNPRPVQYPIRLIPDQYPESEILSPAQDLEISGDEILPVIYTAKDDFGITAIRLGYQLGGIERFINLKSGNSGRFLEPEAFQWDLSALTVTSGDRVVYRLEVSDNDSVSGPKLGYSRAFTLSVRDEKTRTSNEREEAQKIADALLDLLADQLEETKNQETLKKGMEEILKQVDQNLEKKQDRVERLDLEALKRNLNFLKEKMSEGPKEVVTREMERLALLAEDIAKKARMKELEAMAREVRSRERRLLDSIHELKEGFTREGLEAALKELKKIEELLHSVMEALSQLATGLPDEFINSQEIRGLEFQDLFKDLEEIRKSLLSGDMKAALEAAQRLLQALSQMMAAMGRAGAQAGLSPFDRLQREMSHQSGELDKIVAEQQSILNETEQVDQKIKRQVEEETGKRLSLSRPRFKEILEQFKNSLSQEQSDSVRELERLLEGDRLEGFFHLARELEKELSEKDDLKKFIRELKEMTDQLNPDAKEIVGPDEKAKFPELSFRQKNLKERTGKLNENLEMLAQLFPGMDTEVLDDLREATGSMGEASQRLGGEDAQGAIPPEQQAIRKLTKSQQAMQQMAQQMAMRMQAGRWGYPFGYDPRPGWYYGPWIPMPTLPQPQVMRPKERGLTGIDREEFNPPSKDAYKVPKIFREKAMESLKEGVPSQYRREVERYFRGVTE